MEKRSRRRIRDLVAHPASQGLVANENRCARISMMARSANAPLKGRIQKRKTNNLHHHSGLQRTAGPYRCATNGLMHRSKIASLLDHLVGADQQRCGKLNTERPGALEVDDELKFDGLLDRQVRRRGALQYLVYESR